MGHRLLLPAGCALDLGRRLQCRSRPGACVRTGIHQLHGIEINRHAVEAARARLSVLPGVDVSQIVHGSADALPFADSSIDVATAIETLEHVPAALRPDAFGEVWRVLRPGAPFVITVPAQGLFAWLDPSNVRLRFPRLFAVLSRVAGGRGREHGYDGEKHDIVWHHHFRVAELRGLVEPAFHLEIVRGRGCIVAAICGGLLFPFHCRQRLRHPIARLLHGSRPGTCRGRPAKDWRGTC